MSTEPGKELATVGGMVTPLTPRDFWEYEDFVNAGRELQEASSWLYGDLAAGVHGRYGEARLKQYAEDIGVPYSTLKRCRTVARAFPRTGPRGPFSVCRELAALKDRLALVSGRDDWTVAQARELAASLKPPAKSKPAKVTCPGGCGFTSSDEKVREHVSGCGPFDAAWRAAGFLIVGEAGTSGHAAEVCLDW